MKDVRRIYVSILLFVSFILVWAVLSHGDFNSRHNLGYVASVSTNDSVTLNASAFTEISDSNLNRIYFMGCNTAGVANVYLCLGPAGECTNETGIYLKNKTCWIMPSGAIYTGKISAIATSDAPKLTFVEY
ncbi:hypothetical protein KAR91_77895 [Candidatus Pacearchaeota archaeon]|nr:hypothetical protein [Candidatus Pacearchaeota archaeon]